MSAIEYTAKNNIANFFILIPTLNCYANMKATSFIASVCGFFMGTYIAYFHFAFCHTHGKQLQHLTTSLSGTLLLHVRPVDNFAGPP